MYPHLKDRHALPSLYIPSLYFFYGLTLFIPGKTARLFITFPIVLLLVAASPFYTNGSVADDYGAAAPLITVPLMYLDYLILTPREGSEVRFRVGRSSNGGKAGKTEDEWIGEDECAGTWEKVKWALRLISLARGIGANVQVKGVPAHPNAHLSRGVFVRKAILRAAKGWVGKLLGMWCAGFALGVKTNSESKVLGWIMDVVVGWGGATWAYQGITWLYNSAAAVSVAVGVCEPRDWPPIFGPLSEGWSVRQMWSVVWHQMLRRLLQKPGIRLVNLLGFRKGTVASKYLQLYVAFTISMALHEWMNFLSVRQEAGEFRFFMSQAVAITAEDFVQWLWRRYAPPQTRERFGFASTVVGYVWAFAWFSYSLALFLKPQLSVGIAATGLGDPTAVALGQQAGIRWQRM